MGVGSSGNRIGSLALALLVAAAVLCAALATDAGAARLVGKDGKVYACYKAKGRSKGAVRLVTKKGHCRHGEKKISWNVSGPAGEAGQGGENGGGESGPGGETGAAGTKGLEQRVNTLTSKVSSLEGILKGISNADLTGMLSKLQGVSGTQLQETVASLADVKALCTQTKALTEQTESLTSAFGKISLSGTIPPLLGLFVPTVADMLKPFAC